MQLRIILTCLGLFFLYSCGTDNTDSTTSEIPEAIIPCSFQMQSVQNLPSGNYKLVSGLRYCENDTQITKELMLFAHGEPIDNKKECNVFATTDTSIVWDIELAPLKVGVRFKDRMPADSTFLLKQETVYDSIEVTYSVVNAIES